MRILMLGAHPGIRGALPKIIPLLARALRNEGFEVVECGWGRHHEQESWWDKIVGRWLDIFRIFGLLWREWPDILFINSRLDGRALLRDIMLLLSSRGLDRPTVMLMHGSRVDLIAETGHRIFKVASRLLFGLCQGVILLSQSEKRELSCFAPRSRFFVADYIYQPEVFAPRAQAPPDWGLPADTPIVFFAARLIPEKGILDLLSAIPLVLQEAPCHFLLAGVGPLEQAVRERLSRSPWKEHASYAGYLKGGDLELAYNSASLFVLPTYYGEGFPVVILEALDYGLPIVTTSIRGVADHLLDGVHARLIPPKNPARLAQALVELLKDPGLRQSMAAANRQKVQDFRPEVVVKRYVQIFQQVLGSKAESR